MLFTTRKLNIHKEDSLGENIRLISDILHYTADPNLEGISLFMHFQKGFRQHRVVLSIKMARYYLFTRRLQF